MVKDGEGDVRVGGECNGKYDSDYWGFGVGDEEWYCGDYNVSYFWEIGDFWGGAPNDSNELACEVLIVFYSTRLCCWILIS